MASIDAVVRGPAWQLGPGVSLRPTADAAYSHLFGDERSTVTSQLISDTALPVSLTAAGPDDHRFDLGLGAELAMGTRFTVGARYGRRWADDLKDADTVSVTARFAF